MGGEGSPTFETFSFVGDLASAIASNAMQSIRLSVVALVALALRPAQAFSVTPVSRGAIRAQSSAITTPCVAAPRVAAAPEMVIF